MTKFVVTAIATLMVITITLAISHYYAMRGRPDAVWLWRDVLGIIH